MVKNIFFDFDGVLCESVELKAQAFYQLYLPFGKEIAEAVLSHHLANTGVSRYKKIKYYHHCFLHEQISDEQVQALADVYSKAVVTRVLQAPEVQGATAFLSENYEQYSCWIISATPIEEMRLIVAKKDWSVYFKDVLGAPQPKTFWTDKIIQREDLNPRETIFIGDALADKDAADHAGITFVLRRTSQNNELFRDFKGFQINDIHDLPTTISTINKVNC